jgi:hypothetical protein
MLRDYQDLVAGSGIAFKDGARTRSEGCPVNRRCSRAPLDRFFFSVDRPDLSITLNPHRTYNNFPGWHRDHRVTGRVVLDCVYPLARDDLAFPELSREYEPHSVREVHFVQWEQPRLVVGHLRDHGTETRSDPLPRKPDP